MASGSPTPTTGARSHPVRFKRALVGDPAARFVYLGNFEVERQWAIGEVGLPRTAVSTGNALVSAMGELALSLAGPDDAVVLTEVPDPGLLDHLRGLGMALPDLVPAVHRADPAAAETAAGTLTAAALADPAVVSALSRFAHAGAYLLPHGVSALEERLAARTGLRLAGSGATVAKAVNSKLYSRRIADELALRQPVGWACASLAEFAEALAGAERLLATGARVVVKDAFGVAGKGSLVITTKARLGQVRRLVEAAARRAMGTAVALVVEEWVAKSADLSYQFTIGRTGQVRFDHAREAVIDSGVHQGNRYPARLTAAQTATLRESADRLGARLAADGYRGVVGVDAMLDPEGGVYPINEINARNTMSTYSAPLVDLAVAPGMVALSKQYPVWPERPVPFERLRTVLGGRLLDAPGGEGVLVPAFATVNAGAGAGRLYVLLVAATAERLAALDVEVCGRLEEL
jgi:hypothetical protein